MTVIGLIRHGVTDWNEQMRAQGHTDIPLNEEGRRQAERLGVRTSAEAWDFVYSSDLGRAMETARNAAESRGLEIVTDTRLREVFLGEIEGTTEAERVTRWGDNWRDLDLGGEPREAVADRGVQAIHEIADRHPGKRVLIVSHGGLIGLAFKRLVPQFETTGFIGNTSVTLLRRTEEGRWECELFNCTKHLQD
ncbi:histidine phosphatase family protein [Paenibacillus mesophilus]|uniref:histidine phosphatase family protein n=1 Tax=Paenibacillus mesophilus TaxID=2582849 RepID=UPI00110EB793|nr:histidine phosphatase family protein [Paenibacillus mesophilus]TMV51531.1 histidine phosphatase family protein [Paenibacillus mesophilus]